MADLIIVDEREAENRYAAYSDGCRVGCASAILVGETVLANHVEVAPGWHDLGVGSLLVRRVLDDARYDGHTALALCPYVRRWVDLHPSYQDVARRPRAGETSAVAALISADRTMRRLHRGSDLGV